MLSGKENKPPAELSMGKKQQHGLKTAVVSKPAAALGRSSKQLFLDLGQSDFSASKCAVCGMVYAKGHEEDEKLHRSFHSSAVQGLKFQGWAQERLVLMEPLAGRLLMLLPTDPPAHVKKVQEVCSFIEKWHGLSSGWLMAAPQCKVFLYVSMQKRVVGLAVVEPIKHAYKLAAPAEPVDQEVDSCQLAGKQQPNQQQQLPQPGAATAAAAAGGSHMDVDRRPAPAGSDMQPPRQQQQQQRSLLWAGLHRSSSKRSRLQALLPASATTQVHSTGKLQQAGAAAGGCASAATTSYTAGGSSAVKADSCPPSLLMAAELMQVGSAAAALAAAAQPGQQQQQPEQQQLNQVQQPEQQQQQQQQQQQHVSQVAEQSQLLEVQARMPLQPLNVQQGVQQQQQQQQQQQAGSGPAAAGSKAPGAGSGSSKAGGSGTGRAGSSQCGGSSVPSATAAAATAAAASGAGVSLSWGGRSGGGAAAGSGGSKPRSGAAGAAGDAGGCMVADKRRAVRAMLGVRMVWVSSEQRRKGMATKLLDAARCNMVPGYVVPRSQLAFTQPSEEGARLAAAFTGTQQFMVYGIE